MSDESNGKTPEQEALEETLSTLHDLGHIGPHYLKSRIEERARAEREAFVDKVMLSKPCSPVTRRAIEYITKHANADIARLDAECAKAKQHVQDEHRAALEQLAQDAAVSEGIDLALYQLQAPGDVPPYWKPR